MGLADKEELRMLLQLLAQQEQGRQPVPDTGQQSYPGSLPMRFPQGEPGGGLPVPDPFVGPRALPTPPDMGQQDYPGSTPTIPRPLPSIPTIPRLSMESLGLSPAGGRPSPLEGLSPSGGMEAGGYGGIEGGTWGFPPQTAGEVPRMELAGRGEAPSPFPDAPLPPPTPDSRLGAPPADERGGYSGGRLRFPGLPEEAGGELPAAPEKEGDLSRARASGELEKLYAMQALGEGLGGMEVVTAGDILHRTAKGVGPGKPRGQALKSYTDFLGRKELGGIGAKDAMALQGLKGTQALEQIKAKDVAGTYGGLTEDQRKQLITERGTWKSNVRIRKLQEASDAAAGLLSMITVEGTISHQMAARMLLAASGEERYSEQDLKGVLESQGLVQSWWDYAVKKVPGNMSDRLKDEYTRVAREMKRIKDVSLSRLADEWAEGFSGLSGIPAERIKKDAYNVSTEEEIAARTPLTAVRMRDKKTVKVTEEEAARIGRGEIPGYQLVPRPGI